MKLTKKDDYQFWDIIIMSIIGIIVIYLIASYINALYYIPTRKEQSDCYTWKRQLRENELFYVNNWQKQQCDFYKINLK